MSTGIDWAHEITKPDPASAPVQAAATGASGQPTGIDWGHEITKPTFDQAAAEYEARRREVVQTDRLRFAQELGDKFPNEFPGEVPIEPFTRATAPPIQPAKENHFGATVKAGLVDDDATKRRILAQSMFPNDPGGMNRVGMIDGRPVFIDDEGKLREVSSTFSNFTAKTVANAPELIAGGVGAASPSPVGTSALLATGAHAIKRTIAGAVFDEPQTVGGNVADLAGEAAVNLAGGVVGKGIGAVAGRGKIVDFTPANVRSAEQARQYIKQSTGIDVDLAQASGNNKLIGIRAYAARFPGKSAELVQAADDVANGQLDTAVNRVMDQIAKATPAEVAGSRGINAAGMVIELAKAKRNQSVEAAYAAARGQQLAPDVVKGIDADPVLRDAAKKVSNSPIFQRDLGAAAKPTATTQAAAPTVTRVKGPGGVYKMTTTPNTTTTTTPQDTIGFWHQVKQNLDDQIALAAGEPNKLRILSSARASLNSKLEAASDDYAGANAAYAKATRQIVEPLENSAVGVLARITSPKAASAAARIFSDPNITASEIRATRASIVQSGPKGELAWNGLARQWLATAWDRALKETQTGAAVNPAGKLRQALIGSPTDKAKAAALLPPGAFQAFNDLMTATQSLARTPTAGSNTMRDTEIKDQLRGTGAVVFRWLTTPRAAVREAAEQRALEKNTIAITEAILDPKKQAQLKTIVKMAPSTRKALMLTSILGGQQAALAGESPDDTPMLSTPRLQPR